MTTLHDLWTTDGVARMLIDALNDSSSTLKIFESSWAIYNLWTALGCPPSAADENFGYFIINPDDEVFHSRWFCST
jgi:hypothetical protein